MRKAMGTILTAATVLAMVLNMATNAHAVTVVDLDEGPNMSLKGGDRVEVEFTVPDEHPWVWRLWAVAAHGWEHVYSTQNPASSPWVPTGFTGRTGYWTSVHPTDGEPPELGFQREFYGKLRPDGATEGGKPQDHDFIIERAQEYYVRPLESVTCVDDEITLNAIDIDESPILSTWSVQAYDSGGDEPTLTPINNGAGVIVSASEPGEYIVTGTNATNIAQCDTATVTILSVEFKESAANNGFDDTTDPEWLIVPVNNAPNTKTAIAEILPPASASEVDFEVSDVSKATVSPATASSGNQTVTLTGQAKGETASQAKVDSTACKTLNLAVKDKKTVKVAIHFMQDNAGHSTTRNDADAIIDGLNDCYTPQANVVFTKHSPDSPTVPTDLGTVVEWYASNPANEWDDVVNAAKDATADVNLYFVWEYEQDGTPLTDNTAGGTLGTDCIIQDNDNPHTVCHETGHTQGLGHNNSDNRALMKSGGPGFKIFKSEADTLNP